MTAKSSSVRSRQRSFMYNGFVNIVHRLYKKLAGIAPARTPSKVAPVAPRISEHTFDVSVIVHGTTITTIFEKLRVNRDLIFKGFRPSDNVLIKINLNSSFPYPATTSPEFLLGLVEVLNVFGISTISVGDCTSLSFLPTKRVIKSLDLDKKLQGKAELLAFDRSDWVKIKYEGRFIEDLVVSKSAFLADKIINLSNMKTHPLADFSLGMKNLFGFTHPGERRIIHRDRLRESIAELSTIIQPDLTIIDARRMFVTGGPNKGRVSEGNRIFFGTDLISTDLMAYDFLYSIIPDVERPNQFTENPLGMPIFSYFGESMIKSSGERQWLEL